jgi:hypothetical protein
MASSIPRMGNFSIVTFNMHGYNQGFDAINEIICTYEPDCILLQEHWLTPAALEKLDVFSDYFQLALLLCVTLLNPVLFLVGHLAA